MFRNVLVSILVFSCAVLSASAACIANSPPTLSASLSGPDANGFMTISGSWTFHSTDPNFTGTIDISGPTQSIYYNTQAPLSGSFSGGQSICCLWGPATYSFRASAEGCGNTVLTPPINIPSTAVTLNLGDATADPVSATATFPVSYVFPNSKPENVESGLPYIRVFGTPCYLYNAPQSGSYLCTISTSGWATGTYHIQADARNCTPEPGDSTPILSNTIKVNSKPTATLDVSGPDQNGILTFHVSWNFPNTTSANQRSVTVAHDGCCRDYWWPQGPQNQIDSAYFTVNTSCWPKGTHTWVATALNVDTNETGTVQRAVDVQGDTPKVGITLVPNGQTPSGDVSFDATVSWSFPTSTTLQERSVTLACNSGDCPPSLPGITPGPATGSQTVTLGALNTYTHFTATATNTHCSPALTANDSAGAGGCCPAGSAGSPVLLNIGSVQADTTDPLPQQNVLHLTRAYDSDNHTPGLFGTGWTSLLDSKVTTSGSGANQVFVVTLESHAQYLFWLAGSRYAQLWPKGQQVMATLTGNTSSGFVFREGGGRTMRTYSGTGKLLKITSVPDRRDITISYDANGLPNNVADSWGTFSLTITADSVSRLITNIAAGSISWTYQYSAAHLVTVLAPDLQPWRTYTYDGSGHLTEVRDSLGNLVESHTYDANGRGTSSLQATDDVQSIAFNQAGRVPGETVTQVTYTSGRVVSYYVRGTSGVLHTVEVRGGCSSCSTSEDVTYTFDAFNHVVREQDGRGYVKESAYDFGTGQLISMTGPLQPSGCDPATDSAHCRMTTDDLAAATLAATSLTKTTTYAYGDANWPDLPTLITTTSVANPSDTKSDSFTYDLVTGTVLSRAETGWISTTQPETHTTTTTLYNGSEGAAFDPAGPFNSSWLTLPQPAGLRKQFDGARTDVSDLTSFVYYPIDSSVTATWRGRLAAVRDALGHIATYSDYDVFGNAQTVTDPNGVVVNSTYDPLGRLLTTKYPAIPGCDTAADPTCSTDIIASRSYSAGGGPLATETKPRGGVTSYTYDGRGRVASVTRTISSTVSERVEYDYDPNTGQKSAERFLENSSGSFVAKRSASYSYDTFGRLAQVTYPDSAKVVYTYDVAGALATVQDENHASANTFYSYNATGAVAKVSQTLGTGQVATSYAYDAQGNLISVTDPNGNVTAYAYDDFGRMKSQVSPVTGTTTYGYDVAGNLITTTDANGATTTRTYDALSRVTGAVSSRSGTLPETIGWTYDSSTTGAFGIGRLAGSTFPAGSTTYAYERRGLLRNEQSTLGGAVYAMTYTYDSDGNRASMRYPDNGLSTYTYDLAGRPLSLSPIVTSAQYLPFGPMATLSYANGTTKTVSYDSRYRVTENKLTGPAGTIADYTYSEDAAGNIMSIHDATDPTYNRDFAYDDLNRLVTANSGTSLWGTGSYAYDAMGNLTARSLGTAPVDDGTVLSIPGRRFRAKGSVTGVVDKLAFTYNSTTPEIAVATWNGIDHTVGYDAAGNETSYFATRTYSPRNLLATVTGNSGEGTPHSISYGYDARAVRVTRSESPTSSGAANRYFTYSPELQLLAITDDDSSNVWASGHASILSAPIAPSHDFAYFNGMPVAEFGTPRTPDSTVALALPRHAPLAVATKLYYTFTDHLGTPLLQTDSSGNVVWRAEYEPYGNVWKMRRGSRTDQPLRLPGQDLAMTWEGAEENYNVFRWYRAGWGRYTQPDPLLGKDANANDVYGYAKEDPLRFTDPSGLLAEAICADIAIAGINTPFRHCRLHVTCKECTGGNYGGPFDLTVGLERNRKTGALEINESASYSGTHFDLGISEKDSCNFGKCVRSNAAYFKQFAKGWSTQYSLTGPNSEDDAMLSARVRRVAALELRREWRNDLRSPAARRRIDLHGRETCWSVSNDAA